MDNMTPTMPSQEKPIPRPYKCPYPLCGRAFSRLEHQVRSLLIHIVPFPPGVWALLVAYIVIIVKHPRFLTLLTSPFISDSPHSHTYWRKAICLLVPDM
jgi:hypothetical protein